MKRERFARWYREHRRAATALVVIVAFGLVGGAIAIGARLVQEVPTIAGQPAASPSPTLPQSVAPTLTLVEEPSAEPTVSPTISPSVEPSPAFPGVTASDRPPLPPSWGIVTVDRLNVRTGPGEEHPVVGVLHEGELVQVIEGANWVEVLADGLHGWALAVPGESLDAGIWIRAVPTPVSATTITGITSDGQAYLAYGTWAELEYPPYEGGFEQPLFMHSTDAVTWVEAHDGLPGRVIGAAGGPGGFVAIGYHSYGAATAVHSVDGRSWSEPTPLPGQHATVAHGGAGWLIVGYVYDSGLVAMRSADGRMWDEAVDIPGTGSTPQLEASPAGYLLFDRYVSEAWASTDGRSWQELAVGSPGAEWFADVELVGDRVYAVTVSYETGVSTLRRGTIRTGGSVSWMEPVPASSFAGHRVDSISQGGSGLLALGWEADALVPAAWTSADGSSWQRLNLASDAFGGMIGPEPAWGNGGWVGVGQRSGRSAVFRSAEGLSWNVAAEPERAAFEDPGCPAVADVSVLTLMFLGPRASDCFGDTSLTIRGWVSEVDGLGGCCPQQGEPPWLAGASPAGWLSPAEKDWTGFGIWTPPDVPSSTLVPHTWVEVVGHYDDPASATCRRIPSADFPHRLESLESARSDCVRRFVVETVREVDGP